jgi:surfeit locus 1 family protein
LRLRIGKRVFAPSALVTVATLVVVAGLVSLGRWQIARMHEKEALFASFDLATRDPVPLDSMRPEQRRRFVKVEARGRYDAGRQILLDNLTHEGRAGYQVLTPLLREDGTAVLVNRGWVPAGRTRSDLPAIAVSEAPRRVVGRLSELPRAGIELEAKTGEHGQWPRVMNYPRLEEVREALGMGLQPQVILLDAQEPDGFVREWRPKTFPPERHLGYAVTWFALATTVLILFGVTNLRKES